MPRSAPFVSSLAALLSTASLASAQQLTPRDFLIPESQNLLVVDFAAARRVEVWDDLEASVLRVAFIRIEKEIGYPLDYLDRFQVSMIMPAGGGPADSQQVLVWHGNRALPVHESYAGPTWSQERLGDFDVRRRASERDELFVQVGPRLQVHGLADVVAPMLDRKQPQVPEPPDLQSLLSGREGRLAWLVLRLDQLALQRRFLEQVMGAELSAWPERDLPTHLSLQVLATNDKDDPHVAVRAVLRHRGEGEGVVVSQQVTDAFVARLRDDQRLRLLRPLLANVEARRDHGDVVLQVDLGRSRDAAGNLAVLLLPIIGRSDDEVAARKEAKKDGR